MSISGTESSSYAFQKGGGLQVSLGNPIRQNTVSPQNLSLGQSVPRIPEIITPVTGTNETFSARAIMTEGDFETHTFTFAAAANCVDAHLLVAKYNYIIDSVVAKFVTASSSGTFDIKVCDNAEAIASGVSALSSTVSIAGDANTNIAGTVSTTLANRIVTPGQSIAIDFGGTVTSIAGLTVTIALKRMIHPTSVNNYVE